MIILLARKIILRHSKEGIDRNPNGVPYRYKQTNLWPIDHRGGLCEPSK
jgi:hypothetical protein